MKDYSKIEGIKKNLQDEANNIFDKGYQQGFHDGEDSYLVVKRKAAEETEGYQKGLHDAWECARKIALMDVEEAEKVFGEVEMFDILGVFDASRAIAIIQEYEEKQKQADDEIKVGDEIIYGGTEYKGFVTKIYKIDKTYYRCVSYDGDFSTENSDNPPKKTGRHFSEIEDVLLKLADGGLI